MKPTVSKKNTSIVNDDKCHLGKQLISHFDMGFLLNFMPDTLLQRVVKNII